MRINAQDRPRRPRRPRIAGPDGADLGHECARRAVFQAPSDGRNGASATVNASNQKTAHRRRALRRIGRYCLGAIETGRVCPLPLAPMPRLHTVNRRRAAFGRTVFFASSFAVCCLSVFPLSGIARDNVGNRAGAMAAAALAGSVAMAGASLACAAAAAAEES